MSALNAAENQSRGHLGSSGVRVDPCEQAATGLQGAAVPGACGTGLWQRPGLGSSHQLPDDSSACSQVPETGPPVSAPRAALC